MALCCPLRGYHYPPKTGHIVLSMKTLIEVHREGIYFVAIDLLTNVADQGHKEQEALQN